MLLPRGEGGSPDLVAGLRERGAEVDELVLYESRAPAEPDAEALRWLREGRIDVVTFASSSSVRNLKALLGRDFERLRDVIVACIGPVTAATARELGLAGRSRAVAAHDPGAGRGAEGALAGEGAAA